MHVATRSLYDHVIEYMYLFVPDDMYQNRYLFPSNMHNNQQYSLVPIQLHIRRFTPSVS